MVICRLLAESDPKFHLVDASGCSSGNALVPIGNDVHALFHWAETKMKMRSFT
jgi:hypothetical protein